MYFTYFNGNQNTLLFDNTCCLTLKHSWRSHIQIEPLKNIGQPSKKLILWADTYKSDIHCNGCHTASDGQHAVVDTEPVAQDRSGDEHSDHKDWNVETKNKRPVKTSILAQTQKE